MLLHAAHENHRPVGRFWYALSGLMLLVFCDIFSKAASLDGLPVAADRKLTQ